VPHHHGGALAVGAVVLGQQLGVGRHVVVEEEEELATCSRRSGVDRRRPPRVRLLDHPQGEARIEASQRLGRAVGRAIDGDHHLEVAEALLLQGGDAVGHGLASLVGGNDHAEASQSELTSKRSSGAAVEET
jgi:hypothetical protein